MRMHSNLKIDSNDAAPCSPHSNELSKDKRFIAKSKTLPSNYPMSNCQQGDGAAKTRSSCGSAKSPWTLLCSGAITVPIIVPQQQQQKHQQPQQLLPSPSVDKLKNEKIMETAPASIDESILLLSPIDLEQPINLREGHYENATRTTQTGIYISQTQIKLATPPTNANSIRNDCPPNSMNNKIESPKPKFSGMTSVSHGSSETANSELNAIKYVSMPDVSMTSGDVNHRTEWSPIKLKKRAVSIAYLNDGVVTDPAAIRSSSYPNMATLQKSKRSLDDHAKDTLRSDEVLPSFSKGGGAADASMRSQPMSIKIENANESTSSASVYLATSPNRFGSKIWRSFNERRKPKSSKDQRCYKSDCGIQIKLDIPQQNSDDTSNSNSISKTILREKSPAAGHGHSNKTGADNNDFHSMRDSLDSDFVTQIQELRRAYSSTITDMNLNPSDDFVEMNAMKHLLSIESPKSLPMRSFSQSRSLNTFDTKTTDSQRDSNSATSTDDAAAAAAAAAYQIDFTSNGNPEYAEVVHNFIAVGPEELNLVRGTIVEILDKEPGNWWLGRTNRTTENPPQKLVNPETGWFPKEFVRITQTGEPRKFLKTNTMSLSSSGGQLTHPSPLPLESSKREPPKQDRPTDMDAVDRANVTTIIIETPSLMPKETQLTTDSSNVLRTSAINELLTTEINYVKLLTSICEGYLPGMTKRIDIFSPNSIRLIFSNIATINEFQRSFLQELRKGVEQDQIAKIFIKMHKGFLCYSKYCNSYPRALIELESFERVKEARTILESCRASENLAEFPLSAHLLSPVQRICRYPLHLSEIFKFTSNTCDGQQTDGAIKAKLEQLERLEASQVDLPDTQQTVEMALEAMRSVTEAVNEGKRHSETITRHQESFQNFKGPPLHVHSVRFFLQIDATRQKQNLWNSSYTLFLFDNQIVYSKRDIIKRNHFIYKGRIFIDRSCVVNVRDGKMFSQTIKNALRIYCEVRDKWYDFCFRSANRKQKFLHTLALERQFSGKVLNISEMAGFDYGRTNAGNTVAAGGSGECSDQSDYEFPEMEYGANSELLHHIRRDGGYNSLPQCTSIKLSSIASTVTLPIKFKARDCIAFQDENQTNSMGRKRMGIWFRKPKNSTSTPNLSPKHKPLISLPLLMQSKELQLGVINRLGSIHNGDVSARAAEI